MKAGTKTLNISIVAVLLLFSIVLVNAIRPTTTVVTTFAFRKNDGGLRIPAGRQEHGNLSRRRPILFSSLKERQRRAGSSSMGNDYLWTLEQQTLEMAAASTTTITNQSTRPSDDNYLMQVQQQEETIHSNFMSAETTTTIEENDDKKDSKNLMNQIKEAGTAGIVSYALWEFGFWLLSVPVVIVGYKQLMGHYPDFSNQEDLKKLGAEAFAFVNVARFAVPLRIGLALSTTPWIQTNLIDRFFAKTKTKEETEFFQ